MWSRWQSIAFWQTQSWHGVAEALVLPHQSLQHRKFFCSLLHVICPFTRVEDLPVIKSTQPPRMHTLGSFQGDNNDSWGVPYHTAQVCYCGQQKQQKQWYATTTSKLKNITHVRFPPCSFCHLTFPVSHPPTPSPLSSHLYKGKYARCHVTLKKKFQKTSNRTSESGERSFFSWTFGQDTSSCQCLPCNPMKDLQPEPLELWLRNHKISDKVWHNSAWER